MPLEELPSSVTAGSAAWPALFPSVGAAALPLFFPPLDVGGAPAPAGVLPPAGAPPRCERADAVTGAGAGARSGGGDGAGVLTVAGTIGACLSDPVAGPDASAGAAVSGRSCE